MSANKMRNSLWNLLVKNPKELRQNELTLVNYYMWLKGLAVTLFEWKNMPDTIDLRYLENTLFSKGKVMFFNDEQLGFLCLHAHPSSDVNVYGRPLYYKVNSHSYNKTVKNEDGVLIFNNDLEEPSIYTVGAFAERLSHIERTIDININAQKTPILLLGDRKQSLTLKNIYKQYDGNAPVIYGDKDLLNLDTLKAINTEAPYVVDKLDQHKVIIWNEILTYLGISNSNTEKKERLIVDEVNANNQHVEVNANVMLKTRKEACKKINEKFNLNVSVELRYSPKEIEEMERQFFPPGGV